MQAKASEAYHVLKMEGLNPNDWLALFGVGKFSSPEVMRGYYHVRDGLATCGAPRSDILVLRTTYQNGEVIERLYVRRTNHYLVTKAEQLLREV